MADIATILALLTILLAFIIMSSVFWPNQRGAPWIPTRIKKVRKMLTMADIKPGEIVYDLGCGDGRVLIMAARKFKAKAIGIEIDLLRFLWCQLIITILGLRRRIKVIYGDFFHKDLSNANVIICYLLQSTNDRLEEKLIAELPPNTRVISNTFYFQSLPLIEYDELGIFLYNIGEKKSD